MLFQKVNQVFQDIQHHVLFSENQNQTGEKSCGNEQASVILIQSWWQIHTSLRTARSSLLRNKFLRYKQFKQKGETMLSFENWLETRQGKFFQQQMVKGHKFMAHTKKD